ncbi:MAG: low molecular weight protein arginine phosphatase [Kiritimatiellia bacterium]|jgi:protein-tyrosine-phosphatase
MDKRRLLFVCSGNTCRSPMAEHLLRAALPADCGWIVESAGTMAVPGEPANPFAIAVLSEEGIDLSPHRSRIATPALLHAMDLVVPMTRSHREELAALAPSLPIPSSLLSSFLPGPPRDADLPDPIGGPLETYRACRDAIRQCLPGLIGALLHGRR